MSYFRAQHVFVVLMGISAILAFLVPPQYSRRVVPQIEILFEPVSRPAGALAAAISDRISPPVSDDRRKSIDVRRENEQLRNDVAALRTQLDEMYRRDAELSKLGPVKDFCRLFKTVGADSGTRESLSIAGSSLEGLKDDQYVLYPGGLVGQIERAGPGGAQVRLITDPAFRIRVRFVRFATVNGKTVFEHLGTPIVLAQGAGNGTMVVRGLDLSDIGLSDDGQPIKGAETLHEQTDYAVLFDGDCARQLQGETLGRIIRIAPRPDARGFAEIRLQPTTNLKKLREVMVMTKEN